MQALWFVYSLTVAFLASTIAIISKIAMREVDALTTSILFKIITILIILPFAFPLIHHLTFNGNFLFVLAVASALNGISTILYFYAVKHGEVSLAVPLLTLTPAFMLFTSPIILDELPPLKGVAGIILIVAGAYILGTSTSSRESSANLLAPFAKLIHDRSAACMMVVAFLWSITANLDKVGARIVTPLPWIFLVNMLSLLVIILFTISFKRNIKLPSLQNTQKSSLALLIVLAGLIHAAINIIQIKTIMMTYASYVIAVKRMSALFTVILARLLFNEKAFQLRFVASFLMVCGASLLLTS